MRRVTVLLGLVVGIALPVVAGPAGAKPSRANKPTTTTTSLISTTTTTTVPVSGKTVYAANYGTSTAALQAAANDAAGGTLVLDRGVIYTITAPLRLPTSVVVQGNGATLKTAAGSTTSTTSDGILDITDVSDIDVSGLTFDGNIAAQTSWSQWRHAVRVLDATNVRIHDNTFTNLIGDGVYINHRPEAAPPYRCSSNVQIYNSTFSGTHSNRNGVSLVCGQQIGIHDNTFIQMARPDMPGSIDIEPNRSAEFIRSVEIYGNTIQSGGPSYAVSGILYLDGGAHAPVDGVAVHHNTIRGSQLKFGIAFYGGFSNSKVSGVTVSSNDIRTITYSSTAAAIDIEQGVPATVTGNIVDNVTGWGIKTYQSCVTIAGNTVTNVTHAAVLQEQPAC